MHFTPTYLSWINQVERLFAEGTRELLQRSDHRNVQALKNDLRNWVKGWNENPKPFIGTKTAEEIRESLGRLLKRTNGAGHSEGTKRYIDTKFDHATTEWFPTPASANFGFWRF